MIKNTCARMCSLAVLFLSLFVIPAWAQTPSLINYQGRLLDGTNLVNGTLATLYLNLYNGPVGGTLLYSDESVLVPVVDGLYSTYIGDGTVFGSLYAALTNDPVWLEVVVNGTPLAPRDRMVSVPYALNVHGLLYTPNRSVVLNPVGGTNYVRSLARDSLIGGGKNNRMEDVWFGAILSGEDNVITNFSDHSLIAGGFGNAIGDNVNFAMIGGGQANRIESNADGSAILSGSTNTVDRNTYSSVIAGGAMNLVSSNGTALVIGGGSDNRIGHGSTNAVISGGDGNEIGSSSDASSIVGGFNNNIGTSVNYAVVAGGAFNLAVGDASIIGGGSRNEVAAGAIWGAIVAGDRNQLMLNALGSFIGGGEYNQIGVNAEHNVIGGGFSNIISGSTVKSVIAGGEENIIRSGTSRSSIGGGSLNQIGTNGNYNAIGGGLQNAIYNNVNQSAVIGGSGNAILNNADYATIAGGRANTIGTGADYAFAAGRNALADHSGSFVWADDNNTVFGSTAANQFNVRSVGGVRFVSGISGGGAVTSGVTLAAGSGTWTSLSDVNAKENFREIDGEDVLAKLAAIPVREWNYKTQDVSVRHIGPTAQDFHAAFGVGDSQTGISIVDADGVALAAIQALAKNKERMEEMVSALEEENLALRERLETLEKKLGY